MLWRGMVWFCAVVLYRGVLPLWCCAVVLRGGAVRWCGAVVRRGGTVRWCCAVVRHGGAARWCGAVVRRGAVRRGAVRGVAWASRHDTIADCDQRDERFGWTGDSALTADEAAQNFDMGAFYHNWLRMLDDSSQNGWVGGWVGGCVVGKWVGV
jgi:hypothetical protein